MFHGPQSTCSHVPSFVPQYVRAAGSQTLWLSQAFCLLNRSRHSLWNKPASTGSRGALHSASTGRLTHPQIAGLCFHAPAHPHSQLSSVNGCSRLQAHLERAWPSTASLGKQHLPRDLTSTVGCRTWGRSRHLHLRHANNVPGCRETLTHSQELTSTSSMSKDQRRSRQQHWKGSEFHPGKRHAGYRTRPEPKV